MNDMYIYGVAKFQQGFLTYNGTKLVQPIYNELDQNLNYCFREIGIAYPKFFKMDPISKTGFLCAEILVRHFPEIKNPEPYKVGVLINTCSGSSDSDSRFQETISSHDNYFPSPGVFVYTLPNIVIGEICIRHGFKGENLCLISSKSDSKLMHINMKSWFSQGFTDYCICGWIDAKENQSAATLLLIGKDQKNSLAECTIENINMFCASDLS